MALTSPPQTRSPFSVWQALVQRPELLTLTLVLLLALVIGLINPVFFTPQSLFDLLRASTVTGIFALGVLLVLAAGGIDVSFTAIAAFCLYTTTLLVLNVAPDAPFALPLLISIGFGLLLGLLNGLIVHRFRAPSLIVTIGTQYMIRGFLLAFIGTKHIMNIPEGMDRFGRWSLFQFTTAEGARASLPVAFLLLVAVALLTGWILSRTLLGRAIYAVGGSVPIAERLGIPVRSVYLFVFGYAGLLAGLGGLVHASLNQLANPFDLVGTELDVIAAVVLGGARVTGGTGTVIGTLLGVVLVVMI
ncbi:MAG: ABC transporter permease, partial [Thermaceae bacterium]|nr:ABC transporter permease [Thermaceae bacterium]